jgi:hypothetical protein
MAKIRLLMTIDAWLLMHDYWCMTIDAWLLMHDYWSMTIDAWMLYGEYQYDECDC